MTYYLYNKITGEPLIVSKEDYEKIRNKEKLTSVQQKAFYLDMDIWTHMPPTVVNKIKVEKKEEIKIIEPKKEPEIVEVPNKLKLTRKTNVKNRKQSYK